MQKVCFITHSFTETQSLTKNSVFTICNDNRLRFTRLHKIQKNSGQSAIGSRKLFQRATFNFESESNYRHELLHYEWSNLLHPTIEPRVLLLLLITSTKPSQIIVFGGLTKNV